VLAALREPWPWYVAGPLIGLCVPALLIVGNRPLGTTGALRAMCAATIPSRSAFFRYDWRADGGWSLALVFGILVGGFIAGIVIPTPPPEITAPTRDAIAALGLGPDLGGMAPPALFSWHALATLRGWVFIVGGGLLVGFGASYAGGCTSGHGVTGLADLQPASLIALMGIFAGGLLATFYLIPLLV